MTTAMLDRQGDLPIATRIVGHTLVGEGHFTLLLNSQKMYVAARLPRELRQVWRNGLTSGSASPPNGVATSGELY